MDTCVKAGNPDDIVLGRALIAAGKVGCIVLAGGDGSRLGWDGPKGTFPVSLVKGKSLFQLLSDKVEAASIHFEQELQLAVMTSPLNHQITQSAFVNSVECFSQNLIPLLDSDAMPLEEKRPNGNGEVLQRFYASGLFEKWKTAGIEFVQVILIDNPLAEPFDPNQVGIQAKRRGEVTLKVVKRMSAEENVGVVGKKDGKLCIIEYSENPPKEWEWANTSLFCFSMDFIDKVKEIELPLHTVKKFLHGQPVLKRETFIFDLLPYADKTDLILYPREEIFAPLKNRKDIGPVQRALLEKDRRAFFMITGTEPKEKIFELDAAFHYPTQSLLQKWKGGTLPLSAYIEP